MVALAAIARPARAREVDQFTDRLFQLEHLSDASAIVDAHVNALLAQVAAELNAHPGADRDDIAEDILQGSHVELIAQLRSPIEAWIRDAAPVELFWVARRGMYGGDVDYDDMGFAWYIENAPVIRIGPLLVGIDKIGHFFGQGWFYLKYYDAWRAAEPHATEAELLRRVRGYGHELEVGYEGFAGTGIYSYADLAANWRGFLFYRALWSTYIVATDGRYRVAREFHILDWASDAWDEVTNPSRARSERFYAKVARYLRAHACAPYRAAPATFVNATGATLDPSDYLDERAVGDRRWDLAQICR